MAFTKRWTAVVAFVFHVLPAAAAARSLPIVFEENRGQAPSAARFLARGPQATFLLAPFAITALLESDRGTSVLRIEPVGSRPSIDMAGENTAGGMSHYFGPAGKAVHAAQFERVRYRALYDGIDLLVYARESTLEYDLVVAPHADPFAARFRFQGAESLFVTREGDLVISTGAGEVRQEKPVAYQMVGGRRREVNARFVLRGNEVGFAVARWDRTRPLVIDPTVVFHATLSGSSTSDSAQAIAVDSSGNSYITGTVASLDFPTTGGTYLSNSGGGGVFKSIDGGATWTAANSGMSISAACGSPTFANVTALAIDKTTPMTLYAGMNQQYGVYKSTDGGQTWTAVNNGLSDVSGVTAIAVSPTSSSNVLVSAHFGTYLTTNGGTSWTKVSSSVTDADNIVFDPNNSQIVYADSGDFTLDKSINGGASWATMNPPPTVVRQILIDPSNSSTIYAHGGTLYKTIDGGANWDPTTGVGEAVAMDPSSPQTLYLSTSGLKTFTIKKSTNGGTSFSTIATINLDNSATSTHLVVDPTTTSTIYLYATSRDKEAGAVYKSTNSGVTWTLQSSGLPRMSSVTSVNVHPTTSSTLYVATGPTYGGNFPVYDAFVTKLGPTGSVVWSSYLGGRGIDRGQGIALDTSGNVWVGGYTLSRDFPVTGGAVQSIHHGGDELGDLFLTKLNPTGSSILYSTYLGGSDDETMNGLASDATGAICVTGLTYSTDYPEVSAAYTRPVASFNSDVFVTKLSSAGAIVYSTYLGGAKNDVALSIAVDGSNAAYVLGIAARVTSGTAFPSTAIITPAPSSDSVFVAKFTSAGAAVYSTLLGPTTVSFSYLSHAGVAVDSAGAAYVTLKSNGELATVNPIYAYNSSADAWVGKLNAAGTALVYATYVGGTSSDEGTAIVVNNSGEAIVSGYSSSTNFPLVSSNSTTPGLFLTKINAAGSALTYSSFLDESRKPYAMAILPGGDVFLTGAGSFGVGNCTYLLVDRIAEPVTGPAAPTGLVATAITATRVDLTWSAVAGATSYQIDRRSGSGAFSQIDTSGTNAYSDLAAAGDTAHLYRVRAVNGAGASPNSPTDFATTVVFTDASLNGIAVKAIHLSQLRTAVNAMRVLASLTPLSFTDAAAAGTTIRGVHITELRTALDEALPLVGGSTSAYGDASPGGLPVKATHVLELRGRTQ